ncbi:fatty-acid-binding protein 1-like [Papaver somniferum]|uniref:fatty-acid-binding protein 1-like n=1 Tax=Papaver somniferum TaxID=3469 RepID=UPI000E6FCD83|nr:fatty-acid-binding protein 1-like [Papaver somniferum]
MVSLRFPFSFSQPPKNNPKKPHDSFSRAAMAAGSIAAVTLGFGIAAGAAISLDKKKNPFDDFISRLSSSNPSPLWGSLSLTSAETITDSKTGFPFPAILNDDRRLLGIGLRRKVLFGLKNIDVYAFGVYADDGEIKKLLTDKYSEFSASELKESKLNEDIMEKDIYMTVRLQIAYGRLSIRSVRNAFEDSVGNRLKKFGGADNAELLQSFTSQFKDEYKLPRGSVIDLSREPGHVLRTTIDGKEVGSIQSKLLCRSIFDLYIGEDPFDTQAKEDIKQNLAALLKE